MCGTIDADTVSGETSSSSMLVDISVFDFHGLVGGGGVLLLVRTSLAAFAGLACQGHHIDLAEMASVAQSDSLVGLDSLPLQDLLPSALVQVDLLRPQRLPHFT